MILVLNESQSFDEILMIENAPMSFQQKNDSLNLKNITFGSQNFIGSFSFWVRPLSLSSLSDSGYGLILQNSQNISTISYMYKQGILIQNSSLIVPAYTNFQTVLYSPIIMDWSTPDGEG